MRTPDSVPQNVHDQQSGSESSMRCSRVLANDKILPFPSSPGIRVLNLTQIGSSSLVIGIFSGVSAE